MTTEAKIQITSTELGTLWMSYQTISSGIIIFDLLKDKVIDKDAQNIIASYVGERKNIISKIVNIFNNEKAVIPLAFGEQDIIREVPPLFDDIFCVMFLRQLTKLHLGQSSVFSAMSYMKEVNDVFKLKYDISNKYYIMATSYLLGKGVLARPPYVTMPKQVEFIEDKNYMSGFNAFSEKRALNTIEVGYINEAIEDNIFNTQLLTGFAQVAKEDEVKKYFIEGKELCKKVITELSGVLLQSDIQPPSAWAGKVTDSTEAPFSDKLMMYINSLTAITALGFTGLGTSFSMRNDLPVKLGLISKNTFEYSKKGAKIMIKHKWMEEPPQMEDRNQLTK
ncbi:DUF3231 family protein [Clostridium sp.]|uniref:DUF3231 family protein n=1 Tax=Clostridium sp. TaxID=1506 RepID=UPI003D6CDB50